MNKYKMGDVVRLNGGDEVIILETKKDEAKAFNVSKCHPEIIKLSEIKEKIDNPDYKVVVKKMKKDETDEDVRKVCDDFEEALDETKEELIETLKVQNKFLMDMLNTMLNAAVKK